MIQLKPHPVYRNDVFLAATKNVIPIYRMGLKGAPQLAQNLIKTLTGYRIVFFGHHIKRYSFIQDEFC